MAKSGGNCRIGTFPCFRNPGTDQFAAGRCGLRCFGNRSSSTASSDGFYWGGQAMRLNPVNLEVARRSQFRPAGSLVEMLVVMGIVSTMAAMLLPAIQSGR